MRLLAAAKQIECDSWSAGASPGHSPKPRKEWTRQHKEPHDKHERQSQRWHSKRKEDLRKAIEEPLLYRRGGHDALNGCRFREPGGRQELLPRPSVLPALPSLSDTSRGVRLMETRQLRAHIQCLRSAERAMTNMLILPVGFLLGITLWMTASLLVRQRQTRRQQEIVNKGARCEGKVVAIQRPLMLETGTRFYFDFEPPGTDRLLRVCHIDRRPVGESTAASLHTGTAVVVHYLPEQPRQAVIGTLV